MLNGLELTCMRVQVSSLNKMVCIYCLFGQSWISVSTYWASRIIFIRNLYLLRTVKLRCIRGSCSFKFGFMFVIYIFYDYIHFLVFLFNKQKSCSKRTYYMNFAKETNQLLNKNRKSTDVNLLMVASFWLVVAFIIFAFFSLIIP